MSPVLTLDGHAAVSENVSLERSEQSREIREPRETGVPGQDEASAGRGPMSEWSRQSEWCGYGGVP